MKSWYKVLKITNNATKEEIESAYQKLISNPDIAYNIEKNMEVRNAYNEALKTFSKNTVTNNSDITSSPYYREDISPEKKAAFEEKKEIINQRNNSDVRKEFEAAKQEFEKKQTQAKSNDNSNQLTQAAKNKKRKAQYRMVVIGVILIIKALLNIFET